MFERYTEKARRTIFFARYEASQFGSPYIETEHILLALFREDKSLIERLQRSNATVESIRHQIDRNTPTREKTSTSVDIPLTDECKRALFFAFEESQSLSHPHIGTQHLLLGLLREEKSFAAKILRGYGIHLKAMREEIHHSPAIDQQMPPVQPLARAGFQVIHNPSPRPLPRTGLLLLRSIRIWLAVVITGLILSGITAFPLEHEVHLLVRIASHLNAAEHLPALNDWLLRVEAALTDTNARYPFLAYGTDWLAFAHLVIAAAFIGPWCDPVRNKWLIDWGLICCVGVLPLALIAGPIRGIPIYWRCIDCCFGIFCCPVFFVLRRRIQQLETGRF